VQKKNVSQGDLKQLVSLPQPWTTLLLSVRARYLTSNCFQVKELLRTNQSTNPMTTSPQTYLARERDLIRDRKGLSLLVDWLGIVLEPDKENLPDPKDDFVIVSSVNVTPLSIENIVTII
jgi:hypothetical protein